MAAELKLIKIIVSQDDLTRNCENFRILHYSNCADNVDKKAAWFFAELGTRYLNSSVATAAAI